MICYQRMEGERPHSGTLAVARHRGEILFISMISSIPKTFNVDNRRRTTMSLLALPTELRLEIYGCLLPELCYEKRISVVPTAGHRRTVCPIASALKHYCIHQLVPENMGWASSECRNYVNLLLTCRTINADLKSNVKNFDVVFQMPETVIQERLKGPCDPKVYGTLRSPSRSVLKFLLNDPFRRCDGSYPQGLASLGLA